MGDMGEETLVQALALECWRGGSLDMDLEAVLATALVLEEVLVTVDSDMVDLVMVVVTIMSRTQRQRTQL